MAKFNRLTMETYVKPYVKCAGLGSTDTYSLDEVLGFGVGFGLRSPHLCRSARAADQRCIAPNKNISTVSPAAASHAARMVGLYRIGKWPIKPRVVGWVRALEAAERGDVTRGRQLAHGSSLTGSNLRECGAPV
jgi:hypothetical protein